MLWLEALDAHGSFILHFVAPKAGPYQIIDAHRGGALDMDHLAFISHVSEEKEIAEALKKHLEQDFEGLEVFVSTVSIGAGQEWVEELKKALGEAQVEIVLCSPESVTQPWLNFEAGAAWIRENIQMIPVCHLGSTPKKLPEPLRSLQGVVATDPKGLRKLYDSVAKARGEKKAPKPKSTFKAIAKDIRNLAGTTKGLRRITRMCQLVGDADLLLHTFYGQEKDPIPLKKVAPLSDRATVFRLWADPKYEKNSIHASLHKRDGLALIRIRFTNHRGLPGDVTIRPLGLRHRRSEGKGLEIPGVRRARSPIRPGQC